MYNVTRSRDGLPLISTLNLTHTLLRSILWRHPYYNRNVCDLAAVEAFRVVWAAAASTNAVLHGLELNKVASLAASQAFQAVVGCILENVERVCDVQMTLHSIRLHGFGDVGSARAVTGSAFFLVHLRETAQESHVVHFDCVFDELQYGLVVVGP
jgi:hypothetical protein